MPVFKRRACETTCHPTDLGGVGGRENSDVRATHRLHLARHARNMSFSAHVHTTTNHIPSTTLRQHYQSERASLKCIRRASLHEAKKHTSRHAQRSRIPLPVPGRPPRSTLMSHMFAQWHNRMNKGDLFKLALTQHKRPFWDDGAVCIRRHSSRDSSPTPPSFRAAAQAFNTQPSANHTNTIGHKHDRTAGQLRTYNFTEDIRAR